MASPSPHGRFFPENPEMAELFQIFSANHPSPGSIIFHFFCHNTFTPPHSPVKSCKNFVHFTKFAHPFCRDYVKNIALGTFVLLN